MISDEAFQQYDIYYYEVLNEEKNWSKTETLPETDLINLETAIAYKIRVRVVSTTYQSSVWTDELQFTTADETNSTLSAVDKLREDMVRLGGMRGTVASVLFEELLKKNVTIQFSEMKVTILKLDHGLQ